MIELTDETLKEFAKDGPCLLFYYTDWCPMCSTVREILNKLNVRCGQLCYDDCPNAVSLHEVPGVPTALALREGQVELAMPGLRPKEHYKALAAQL